MGELEEEVIAKFTDDTRALSKPSVSSFMMSDLDNALITDKITKTIVAALMQSDKEFRKIAFVGVKKFQRRKFTLFQQIGIDVSFIDDCEKPKEWLF